MASETSPIHHLDFIVADLRDIDLADGYYAVSPPWRWPEPGLEESVRRWGILSPVGLEARENSFRLIYGFRRIAAARHCGLIAVPARVWEGDGAGLLLAAVADNLATRPLTPLEVGRVLDRLQTSFGYEEDTLVSEILPQLGLQPARQQLQRHLTLARLPEFVQRELSHGLDPAVAGGMESWQEVEQRLFLQVVSHCRLGVNRQRRLWELLDDLRQGEGRPVQVLWERFGLYFPADGDEVPDRRYARIEAILMERRFPRLTEYRRRYQSARQALRLPPEMELQAPPYFEGDSYRLTVKMKRPDDLKQAAQVLGQAADKPELVELFDLLG